MENTCFINVGSMGLGDYLFFVCTAIYLKNKYENIYILYSAVHFNGMMYLINRLFEENNVTNITCIGNPIYKDKNCKTPSKYFIYLDEISMEIYDKFEQYKPEIEVDEYNNIYICISHMIHLVVKNINNFFIEFYFEKILNYLNISIDKIINNINFKLNQFEEIENNNIYQKFTDSINNEKYILVFHCIEREQYNFTFRDYYNDYNKNNYKIINTCKRNNDYDNNREYYLDELINYFPPMYNLHKIIENAEEIHLIDSYPSHYCNIILKNITKNKKVILYNRLITGINVKDTFINDKEINNNLIEKYYTNYNKFKINNKLISILDYNIYNSYETYYPVNYIKSFNTNDLNLFELNFYTSNNYLNLDTLDEIELDEHFNNFDKIVNDKNHYLFKVLPLIKCNSNIGIFSKTLSNDIKLIEVNLSEVKNTKELYISIDKIIEEISCLNNKSLNILLIKTKGDYILKIKPCIDKLDKLDNETIDLDTNYDNIEKSLMEIINHYIDNKNIHYFFPYGNDEDKNNFTKKLINCSYKIFCNKIQTKYQIFKI
jgi:hypothetical protein